MAPYKWSIEYIDQCVTCNTKTVIMCCDKCGDSVCGDNKCCTRYPQYKKEDIILCMDCVDTIEKKFKLLEEPEPIKYTNISQSY